MGCVRVKPYHQLVVKLIPPPGPGLTHGQEAHPNSRNRRFEKPFLNSVPLPELTSGMMVDAQGVRDGIEGPGPSSPGRIGR